MKALAIGDAEVGEYRKLSRGFDPLGDHFSSGLITEGHKRPGEGTPDGVKINLPG